MIKNELMTLLKKDPQQAAVLFVDVHGDNTDRDTAINVLAKNPALLEHQQLARIVKEYLHAKIFDHCLLSADERKLSLLFPEIDQERILEVALTDALIDKATREPNKLSDAESRTLNIVLEDMLIDGVALSSKQQSALTSVTENNVREVDRDNLDDLLTFEYGYELHDLDAVKNRFYRIYEDNLPVSHREITQIKNLHGFNPINLTFKD